MHPLHMYPLKPFILAFFVTVLLTVTGMPTKTNAAETASVKLESDETKPRQINTTGEASAQPDEILTSEKTPETLREISITATRTERETFDAPSSIAVVGPKQLAREPQPTIAEQLRDIPGVQVTDGGIGGGAKRVSIRGESGARVLVLIDGMKISEQKSMDGSMIMIDPLNIERIEVIKGPASVLYGSEAIGGVVNIITRKGGTRPVQASLSATYNSATDSFTPNASFYGSYNGFSYRFSGDYTDAGDKYGAKGRLPNTSYEEKNWSAYMDYTWANGKAGAGYDHYWSSNNIPDVVTTEITTSTIERGGMGTLNVTGPATVGIELDLPKWERDRIYAFAEFDKISDVLKKVSVTPFIQWTRKDFTNSISLDYNASAPSPMPPAGGQFLFEQDMKQDISTSNKQTSYGLNLQTDWTLGKSHYVVAGMDYLYDDLDATSDSFVDILLRMKPNSNNPGIPWVEVSEQKNTNYKYKGNQQTLAAYAQDEWLITSDWTATLGLRATWIHSRLSDTNDPDLEEKSTSDSHLVGNASIVNSSFEDWRLRGTYSQGYRYPSLNQLYIGTSHGNSGYNYPDPKLKPEKSHNFELGARYDANGFVGDFSVFYAIADDYIAIRTMPNTFDNKYTNMDSADTYGAELVLSYTYEPLNLTPYISGAYMHRRYDQGENGGKTSQTGDPRWTSRAGLKYEQQYTRKISVYADVFGRFASKAEEKLESGAVDHQAGWGTANLSLGTRFGEKRKFLVDLGLNNLFDKRYTPAKNSVEEAGFNTVLRIGVDI